jgi:antitoxin component of RelBE/YafQ-DinJ toxin-antitoxin module
MPFSIIAGIELLVILTLVCIIIEYEKDRRKLKKEIHIIYKDMGFRISAHIEQMLKHANALKHRLPTELYIKSPKKNAIVMEVCTAFYEGIISRFGHRR